MGEAGDRLDQIERTPLQRGVLVAHPVLCNMVVAIDDGVERPVQANEQDGEFEWLLLTVQ